LDELFGYDAGGPPSDITHPRARGDKLT
jgi:hypothetical protein